MFERTAYLVDYRAVIVTHLLVSYSPLKILASHVM